MKKYYVSTAVFLFLAYALAGASFFLQRGHSSDDKTLSALQDADDRVQETITDSNKLPESVDLSDVDKSISYHKYSTNFYMLCADFKHGHKVGSSGAVYESDQEKTAANSALQALRQQNPNYNYIYTGSTLYVYGETYKAGHNCFLVQPVLGDYPSGANVDINDVNSNSCSPQYDSNYEFKGQVIVKKVDTKTKTIQFESSNQAVAASGSSNISTPILYKNYDNFTVFCDSSNKTTSADSLQTGQKITFYASDSQSLIDKVVINQ